ncbi:MAG: transketolase [Oscillospiraceae bacterium]|nr:transketolase [Oscillospiraceae bacterium]MDD3832678.1 transketolase [Oscillospiraceae bacterium]MDD4547052.1 transketolase [Oscillospiraceae bacterium]
MTKKELNITATKIRMAVIEGTYNAKSGHPGGSLSIADTLAVLYFVHMRVDPTNPKWKERDRLVLSKGHTAPALYGALALKGYFPLEDIPTLRHVGSHLQGHPDMNGTPGVDMSTGSLGQGVSAACGMALAAKLDGSDRRVYSILGDGELEEGQVWEASMFAAHKKLDNLCLIIDNNNLQIDGTVVDVNSPLPIPEKFAAFGFNVIIIDGHDVEQIDKALIAAKEYKGKPTAIVQKSVKGKGVSFMENQVGWHGVAPNKEQYEQAMQELAAQLKQYEEAV